MYSLNSALYLSCKLGYSEITVVAHCRYSDANSRVFAFFGMAPLLMRFKS